MKFSFFAWLMMLLQPYQYEKISSFQELNYPFETHTVALKDDIQVAYVEEGQGPETLLFIHGLGSYLPAWKKNIEGLRGKYRCIAIDLPGYGKSSKGPYSGSMTFFADVVAEFIRAKGLQNVTLVGHSMGGQISMVTALHHPEAVAKLVLASPAGFETFTEGEKQWLRDVVTLEATRLTPAEQIRTNYAYNFYQFPDDAEFMVTDRLAMRFAKADFEAYCYIIQQSVRGMVDQPVYEYLPQIQQPTLVLYGEQDNLIPNRFLHGGFTRTVAEKGASRLPNATLQMVNHAGHFVQWDQPEAVNAAIEAFLGK